MRTECPHCHTVFRVQDSDLALADGQVRCGHCLAIFVADNPFNSDNNNTSENLTDLRMQAEKNSSDINETANDEQYIITDVIPPELRAQTRQKKSAFGFIGTLFVSIAILLSIAAGIAQYTYYNRTMLVQIPELRPWLEKACVLAKCTLPEAKDTTLFFLDSKNIFTHPNIKNALMISATIINKAKFTQAYPIIELRFSNVRGETIAARRFTASEYLNIPEDQISAIAPDTPTSFTLEIKDPGNEMVSYEFDFL